MGLLRLSAFSNPRKAVWTPTAELVYAAPIEQQISWWAPKFPSPPSGTLHLSRPRRQTWAVAMEFEEQTDEQWSFIRPRLPPQPIVGRKRAYDRKTINGIRYVLATGCRWHDMPDCCSAHQTAWRRHEIWSEEEVWKRILSAMQEYAYAQGELDRDTVAVDSTLMDSKKRRLLQVQRPQEIQRRKSSCGGVIRRSDYYI